MIYVPSTYQDQYSYLNSVGYPYRKPQSGQEKCAIRVRYGNTNLYLQYRPLSGTYWTTVNTPNLPPPRFRSEMPSSSPPTGRQRTCQSQKRAASSSPLNKAPKMSRSDEHPDKTADHYKENTEPSKEVLVKLGECTGNAADKAVDDDLDIHEVFESNLTVLPPIPDQFKSSYARRLSKNSNLTT